jgi:hypothetical protein
MVYHKGLNHLYTNLHRDQACESNAHLYSREKNPTHILIAAASAMQRVYDPHDTIEETIFDTQKNERQLELKVNRAPSRAAQC